MNVGAENQCGNVGNLEWKYQGVDGVNQGGNLSIAVEITWSGNRNDKLKDKREVRIINLV